jgi:Ala-tRNA(Pro) deacylase
MITVYEKIKKKLEDAGVVYSASHHEPTLTSEDASRIRGVPLHEGAKALVIRVSKTNEHVLCVMPANLRLDSKKLRVFVGNRTSFAQDTESLIGCVPGSVPPFGSVLGLKTFCDVRLADNEMIHFNAGSLTDSVTMAYKDYLIIEAPEIVDITV